MFKKDKEIPNASLDDYVFVNKKNHFITEKISFFRFYFTELAIAFFIAIASYFSIYLGTNKFTNQKELENNIDLLTKYFSNVNLENTLLGIFIVIGIISSLNYVVTNSKISLQHILNRLTHSFIDFIFLMLSSMLGLFFAVLEATRLIPQTPKTEELRSVVKIGIVLMILALAAYTFILVIINLNSDKIKD